MFLLNPIRQEKVWGFEDWMASTFYSCVQENLSSVSKNFPLLVKTIKADSFLSVQVHPDDKMATVLETPMSNAPTIVAPERDVPGKIAAISWKRPIINAVL